MKQELDEAIKKMEQAQKVKDQKAKAAKKLTDSLKASETKIQEL